MSENGEFQKISQNYENNGLALETADSAIEEDDYEREYYCLLL